MKKKLFALLLTLTVLTFIPTAAQTASTPADSAHADEIEAYSDTTSLDSTYASIPLAPMADDFDDFDDADDADDLFSSSAFHAFWNSGGDDVAGMFFVLSVLLILFVLSPIAVIGLILWFIYKNRQNRMRLAEMAMRNGQPIPDSLVNVAPGTGDEVRQKGIRQVFLGIGLTFLLGWAAGKIGAGIGILVLCIGIGNLLIARSARNKQDGLSQY